MRKAALKLLRRELQLAHSSYVAQRKVKNCGNPNLFQASLLEGPNDGPKDPKPKNLSRAAEGSGAVDAEARHSQVAGWWAFLLALLGRDLGHLVFSLIGLKRITSEIFLRGFSGPSYCSVGLQRVCRTLLRLRLLLDLARSR